ncbi:rab-GTPase-TBC domain-containing protein [Radiomyces spectabilis]|uniref:rab-GTPase-TBC domain-containing protein n=1 Tax=Radiomyces spectabilis TaxID=64574 RepID=UPI00221F1E29|nr:rab-GTPase-TBC domain-containing protein [Radiomyces spectabilis]KAI8381602.1 rab-GTPase-TBC domain-containing protein [Radiomyces spectabilis]
MPLTRSTTTSPGSRHVNRDRPGQRRSGFRARSISFTHSLMRSKKSDFNLSANNEAQVNQSKRRPSYDARSLFRPKSISPQPTLPSSSFLTVEDSAIVTGAASSIDTGSDDEEDYSIHHPKTKIPAVAEPQQLVPLTGEYFTAENDASQIPSMQPCVTQEQSPKSFANSFKDKLHLTKKGGLHLGSAKRATAVFGLLSRSQDKKDPSSPQLFDDGSSLAYPPPPQPESTERDQYGFIKCTQWLTTEDYCNFDKFYKPIMQRRQQKWRQILSENNGQWPARSSKFKRYIRKGIPSDLRGQAWFHYSGAEAKLQTNSGVYQEYVQRAEAMGYENEHLEIIERDLHRTFPDNSRFKMTTSDGPMTDAGHPYTSDVPAIQTLRRILLAFSLYSPSIGYCQSLNYIAGLLLLFMSEEEAFWTFVSMIHDILPASIYDVTMEGANIDQAVLMMLLSERCPQIWHKISGGKSFWDCEAADGVGMPTCSLVTSHWFLTLFINILPIESVLRVWDCLFYEGQRAIFRVALAIFKMNEQEILSVDDPLEVFQVVQNMPKRMIDCHKLLDTTYHKYASITRVSEQDLERRRSIFKARREERRKNLPTGTSKLRRGNVRGTIIMKAMEARRLVERAKTARR